ncbi:MAG TPA: MlaD family protein [Solirubrobacteraceae bacterium]|nr:MlaD family protein [Solirubrobacteraceae bacterium]
MSLAARLGAAVALVAAAVVIAILVLGSSSPYTIRARFQNASGLVTGNNVLIGSAAVGTVSSIGLTPNGRAEVTMHLHGVGKLHQGTVARIYEDSLSGIAAKYVELEPGPNSAPTISSGGTIGQGHTYSEVNLDALLDSLNAKTRGGLANTIRGEAASLRGKGKAANRTLEYLAPGLASTSRVTQELARDEPAFDGLLVQGAKAMAQLSSRSDELTQLVSNTSQTAGAIDAQSAALQRSLDLLPGVLRRSTTTFAGLNRTLNSLTPVVNASKPNVAELPAFLSALGTTSAKARPTVNALNDLVSNPSGSGDLISLLRESPSLAAVAAKSYPKMIKQFEHSKPQLSYLRAYTPDVVASLADVGQASSYYDKYGHFVRTQPDTFALQINGANELVSQFPSDRYKGLHHVTARCPGSAVQPAPDGSAPQTVPGCDSSQVPPGQ